MPQINFKLPIGARAFLKSQITSLPFNISPSINSQPIVRYTVLDYYSFKLFPSQKDHKQIPVKIDCCASASSTSRSACALFRYLKRVQIACHDWPRLKSVEGVRSHSLTFVDVKAADRWERRTVVRCFRSPPRDVGSLRCYGGAERNAARGSHRPSE